MFSASLNTLLYLYKKYKTSFFCWAESTLFFHPYHVKFKQWTCLNLIFEHFWDIKIKI